MFSRLSGPCLYPRICWWWLLPWMPAVLLAVSWLPPSLSLPVSRRNHELSTALWTMLSLLFQSPETSQRTEMEKWQRTQRIVLCSGGPGQLGTKTHVVLLVNHSKAMETQLPPSCCLSMQWPTGNLWWSLTHVCMCVCACSYACSCICYIHVVRCYQFWWYMVEQSWFHSSWWLFHFSRWEGQAWMLSRTVGFSVWGWGQLHALWAFHRCVLTDLCLICY